MKLTMLLVALIAMPSYLTSQIRHDQKPEKPQAARSVSDARSFMELFTTLEHDWMEAVRRQDKLVLDTLLAPDFILRTSADPEHAMSRSQWIQHALTTYDLESFEQRAVAIRAFMGVVVVSLIQHQKTSGGGMERSGDFLMVDIWVANRGKWQIAARYSAPVAADNM